MRERSLGLLVAENPRMVRSILAGMAAAAGHCRYHFERPGIGICVECRNVVCADCTTQFEGINRCAPCLGRRRAAIAASRQRPSWSTGNVLLALTSMAAVYGLLLVVARWMAGRP